VALVLITGSASGLGRLAAESVLDGGHDVIVHARDDDRLDAMRDLVARGAATVVGDLADLEQTRGVAEQVNQLSPVDAVIHNAGVLSGPSLLPVNIVAPYLLTVLIRRPKRLVYLSSSMHRGGRARLAGMDWTGRQETGSYSDSKLFVTVLAFAIARRWPDVLSNAVDPGWVPTRMGGPGAPDDLTLGHRTQEWLSVSDDADALTTGRYWYHQTQLQPHPACRDTRFQDDLLEKLADHTGGSLG
jgi:NAD(P)-dependent dehydrogenase (short-subunit alcohol dehydrogenase family)